MAYRKTLKHIERIYRNEKEMAATLCEMASVPDTPELQREIHALVQSNNSRLRELQTLLLLHALSTLPVRRYFRSASLLSECGVATPDRPPIILSIIPVKKYTADVLR